MNRYTLALSLALLAPAALAQTPGSCRVGQASGTLDVSEVEATVYTTGTLAYRNGKTLNYIVPKGTGLSPLYASSVWVGGTVGGEFRVAGATYGQGGLDNDHYEFWPGPLTDEGALPDPSDCSAYDRVWVVSVFDLATYEASGVATADLAEWPVGLGAPAVDAAGRPIEAADRDRTIDLAAGERPALTGSQTAFWVLNDVGNQHRTTESAPLGVEVAVTAFAVLSGDPAFDRATFYRYAVTNRNRQPIEDARLSVWADPDLGNPSDDFLGVDTTRSMAYVYNSDELDEGTSNYGQGPPAWGIDVLGGLADDLHQKDLTAMIYASGGDANRSDPQRAVEYARVMRGVWPDGTPMTAWGNGYNQGGEVTTYAFPGRYGSVWSEENTGRGRSQPGDRRFVLSTGPGTIGPGETRVVDVAFLFAWAGNRLDSVEDLMAASDAVQAAYDDGTLLRQREATRPAPPPPPIEEVGLAVGPNPASSDLTVYVRLPEAAAARFRLVDALGRPVADVHRARWPADETALAIDTARLAPGVYVAVLDVRGGGRVTRRVTVTR